MPDINNIEYMLITLRVLAEICAMVYCTDYIAAGNKMNGWQRVLVMTISAAIVVLVDLFFDFPLLPVLVMVTITVTVALVAKRSIANTLGCLMFGIAITFIPEIIAEVVADITGIKTESYVFMTIMILMPLTLIIIGLITEQGKETDAIKNFVNKQRGIIVVVSVSVSIPIVILGHRFLWESLMFWEGYAGTATLAAAYLVSGTYLLRTFLEFQKKRNEMELSSEYNQYLRTLIEEMQRRDHEYKNQLNAIIGMAETGSATACGDIIDFADEIIEQNAKRKSAGTVISENSAVAAYILRMKRRADEEGITFDYHIAKPLPQFKLSLPEFIELIANLTNNAFEAVSRFECEYRNVSLCVEEKYIATINYVGKDFDQKILEKIYNSGFSTKGRNRGYGMTNIMAICKRNGICMNTRVKGDYLEIRLEM